MAHLIGLGMGTTVNYSELRNSQSVAMEIEKKNSNFSLKVDVNLYVRSLRQSERDEGTALPPIF